MGKDYWKNFSPPRLPEQDKLDSAVARFKEMKPGEFREMSVRIGIHNPDGSLTVEYGGERTDPRPEPAPLPGRAITREQKRAVLERVLAAWDGKPTLRLGQLIHNATESHKPGPDLYYIEDDALAELVGRDYK